MNKEVSKLKAIITGASGTIGISLTKYLLENGNEVLAVVRNKNELNKLFGNYKNFKIIECNLENVEKMEVNNLNYDVLYHLAWDGTRGEKRNNMQIQLRNINYTIKALGFAKKAGCKKFIGAGSQAEYGRVSGIISSNTPVKPETAYGIAKLRAGQISKVLANNIGIEHIWTRILSVYGPYDNEKTMIMSSIKEMLNNEVPQYTKAEQLWDYIYTEDVAKALFLIGKRGKNNSIYCIGSGEARPLYEYINIIKNEINPNLEIKFGSIPYSKKQVMHLCADISNLTKDTGFKPEVPFEEGIKRTIKWYKENKAK